MCGIVGILSRPLDADGASVPSPASVITELDDAITRGQQGDLDGLARHVGAVDAMLHGVTGTMALVGRHELVTAVELRLERLAAIVEARERALEDDDLAPELVEDEAARLIAARDAVWAVREDRLRTAREVAALAGTDAGPAAFAGYLAVQQGLSAIDRLEVRGRDSAGIHLFVWGHGLDRDDPAIAGLLAGRTNDALFQSGSVRWQGDTLGFVYKAAAEIGELGDNTRALRRAIAADPLLRLALAQRV